MLRLTTTIKVVLLLVFGMVLFGEVADAHPFPHPKHLRTPFIFH